MVSQAFGAAVLALALGAAPATPKEGPAVEAPRKWLDAFAQYPGARALCTQHVNGGPGGLHIIWTAYATSDPPDRVAAFYGLSPKDDGPSLASGDDKRLSVHKAGGNHPTCEVPPGLADKTVIIVSQAAGVRPAPKPPEPKPEPKPSKP